jgi:hypothetical protein
MRGYASRMTVSLDTRFDVYGIMKPWSDTGLLMETMKDEVRNLTKNDFLIICSGANDIDRNNAKSAFKNMNVIKNVNYTNIVLVSVLFRHDMTSFLNSKLHKLPEP